MNWVTIQTRLKFDSTVNYSEIREKTIEELNLIFKYEDYVQEDTRVINDGRHYI